MSQQVMLISRALHGFLVSLVRFFFRELRINDRQLVPLKGPIIIVANHPNGLIDPVVLGLTLQRPIHFLAKSTLFGNPIARAVMNAFRAVPVYRAKEGDTKQNDKTFALCRELLERGSFLALFPEGISHSMPQLAPLKTGAARIALSAESAANFKLGVHVLPVGLTYEAKERFRSRVNATLGHPFPIADLATLYRSDERAAVAALTERIEKALRSVVLEADNSELWRGFVAVARLILPNGNMAEVDALAHELSSAWKDLRQQSPEQADAISDEARELFAMFEELAVEDATALNVRLSLPKLVRALFPMLTLWPFALLGALLYGLPYQLIGPLARRAAGTEVDLVSTLKVIFGLLIMGSTFALEAAVVAVALSNPWWFIPAFLLGPLLGFTTLRFFERVTLRRQLWRTIPFTWSKRQRLADLAAHRAAFIAKVSVALRQPM